MDCHLGVFLGSRGMKLDKLYSKEIIEYAESLQDQEACGLVVLDKSMSTKFLPMQNQSFDVTKTFLIDPYTFLKHKLTSTVLGIFHSHYDSDEKPSKSDIELSEESGIPYLIYSLVTKKFFLYYPSSYKPKQLLKRPYIRGFYECVSLVKDYYKDKLNIDISKWNDNYWLPQDDEKANKKLLKILNKEMQEVSVEEMNRNDLLLFEIKNKRMHIGVYLGGDDFIHQPMKKLSQVDVLDDYWQPKVIKAFRLKQLV
jgi:proteasome lid subunit RPN8/RPN11